MKKYSPILSAGFVLGLLLLLLNDFYLKAEFHNTLTGKLSDFAGLFIFPMFWATLFPKFKDRFYIGTALFFLFWKTLASQPLIDFINRFSPLSLARVVDYTDYVALLILPLSYAYFNTEKKTYLKINPIYIGALACFAFMATSHPRPYSTIDIKNTTYHFGYPLDTLKNKLSVLEPKIEQLMKKHRYGDEENVYVSWKQPADTGAYFVRENFCDYGFAARIQLNKKTKGSSLTLKGFSFNCYENERMSFQWQPTEVVLRRSFERQIVSKLSSEYSYFAWIYLMGVNPEAYLIYITILVLIYFILLQIIKKNKIATIVYSLLISGVVYFIVSFIAHF